MSESSSLVVPRQCLEDFLNNYCNLIESFYSVRLREIKTSSQQDDCDFIHFNVEFLSKPDGNYNFQEAAGRIQKYVESSLGWAQTQTQAQRECGEDSSYDSECDEESSHRAASRTPSDTLGAEFAEYVTLTPPPNQDKIEFALKLGYSERLARAALQRLGPDPPQNELLAELIKLGARQPPQPRTPPPPLEPEPPLERSLLRPIVIDGSNVAMSHGNKEVFSCRGIEICVDWFRARGHTEITVFVPKWRKEASRPDNPVVDRDVLDRLERERVLVYTPSRQAPGGKRIISYDDRYVLQLAVGNGGVVVSNDHYRDLSQENPEFRKVIDERLLMYSFVNDRFMPPEDPLGRTGPTLEAFLATPAAKVDPPPACPYGRKCTYGNKCKFHHPERAGRPHKSVAERLSERAARALKARDLHTLSLPPSGRPPDVNKKPLGRAQSATPRLADTALTTHFDRAQMQMPAMPGPSQDANPHRKLARQLTLNPAYDPRLARHGLPMHGGMKYSSAGAMHAAAARVASAPAPGLEGMSPASPMGLVGACASESSLQLWEARRRMHYHLAGIFPEPHVLEAMAAHPTETDAQTMCAIILARYRPE